MINPPSSFRCALLLLLGFSASLQAATVGYWRFEGADNTSGFLADSSGNGNTLTENNTVDPVATPFTNPIPQTGASNLQAASFTASQSDRFTVADNSGFAVQDLTIEAYVNVSSTTATRTIATQDGNSSGNFAWAFSVTATGSGLGDRNLVLQISANGSTIENLDSNIQLSLNTNYYVAVSLDVSDTSSTGVTFYYQNLTAGTPLQSVSLTHTTTSLFDSTASFSISGNSRSTPTNFWDGTIDEVRLSNTALSQGQLLAVVPEPSTYALIAAGGVFAVVFARRRRLA